MESVHVCVHELHGLHGGLWAWQEVHNVSMRSTDTVMHHAVLQHAVVPPCSPRLPYST